LQKEADALKARAAALKEEAAVEKELEKVRRNYNSAVSAAADKTAREIVKNAQEEAKAHKEIERAIEASAKAREKAGQMTSESKALADDKERLQVMVELYQLKLKMDAEATKSVAAGNINNANMYLAEEGKIQNVIDAIAKLYPELDKLAQADRRVVEAEMQRQAAMNTAQKKSEDIDYQNRVEAINNYANALINLYNEQTKLNNAVASGRIKEGSEEYAAAQEKIEHFREAAVAASEKLDETGMKTAMSMNNVRAAVDSLAQSEAKMNDAKNAEVLTQMEDAYKNLTTAIRNYNTAQKANDESGMAYWQQQIDGAMVVVANIEKEINNLNVDAATRERILNLIEQCRTAQAGFTAEQNKGVTASNEFSNTVNSLLTRYLSLIAIMRTINSLIKNTVEYVSEYSDKMNEIQMITLKSNSEIDQLASTYRQIAADMSVSSLDMADAAIYFTRQGLEAAEIEKRLRNTTMYAKAANLEFETAAELITSVVNSMNLVEDEAEDGRNAAQRVADVFLAVGDNAATSGEEIGTAMQKAGAAAGAFGMEFEWLAAYIATVSETTRQEASSIGTAFNTLIARLHSIRSAGYNSEDETKINDIQKALANINVTLLDQNGNWRDMTDIFNDIAAQWDTLDGKTKSYIATTMAGVKQQNVFLALMEDLSQKSEGNSRAWELYNIAMDSAGTAQEKYAVYTDSVAAAQERLTVAQEKFYSLLDDSVIKNWYNSLAGIVNMITEGVEQFGSMNLIIPIVATGIGVFSIALKSMNAQLGVTNVWLTLIEKHPIMIAISAAVLAIGALVTVIGAVASGIETAEEKINRLNTTISESQQRAAKYTTLQTQFGEMMDEFSESGGDANKVLSEHEGLLQRISELSPTAKSAVEELKNGFDDQSEAVATLNAELEKYIQAEQLVQATAMVSKLGTKTEESAQTKAAKAFLRNGLSADTFGSGINFTDLEQLELPIEFVDRITEVFDDFVEKGMERNSDTMYRAGLSTMAEFFSGMSAEEYLRKDVQDTIDSVVSIMGMTMDQADTDVIKDNLEYFIFGPDGILNFSEYDGFEDRIASIVSLAITKGFDVSEMFGEAGVIRSIGRQLFGKELPDYFEEELEMLYDDPELMQGAIDGYKQLIAEGFSKADIAEVFKDIGIGSWGDAIEIFWDRVFEEIREKSGKDELEGLWSSLGLGDLNYINKLLDAGVGIDEIQNLMGGFIGEETDDVVGFMEALRNLGQEAGVVAEEIEEATENPSETFAKIKDDIDDLNDAIDTLASGGHISFSDLLDLTSAHPELLEVLGDTEALKEKLAELKASGYEDLRETAKTMLRDTDLSKTSLAKYATDDITTVGELLDSGAEGFDEAAQWLEDATNGLVDAADQVEEASESWLQAQANIAKANADANWAKSNEYAFQVEELQNALAGGGDSTAASVEAALERWNSYDDAMKKSIAETYPGLVGALAEAEAALADMGDKTNVTQEQFDRLEDAQEDLGKVLNKTKKYLETKYFKNTAKAIKDLEEGTISAADAYETFYGECDKLTKAYDEIDKAQTKIDAGTQLVESDVNSLADALGVSADTIINDWPGALEMFEQMRQAGEEAYNALNKEATMRILGVSEADFSNIQNGMTAVQDTASSTIQMLLALGQFKLEEREVEEGVTFPMLSGDGKTITNVTAEAKGKYQFLVPTSANPLKSRGGGGGGSETTDDSGGGGGGGGSSSNSNSMTEVERALDVMSKRNEIQEARRNFYQAQSGYYEQTGQLQGVIAYAQKEIEVLDEENASLEDNIARIEEYMDAKKAELASMSTSDEKYEEVADDLDKLQKAHQNYSVQLINNKADIDKLNKSMDEQRKKIRQMQIDIRELVYKAIEDREAKAKNMLENEIEMEDEILDVITKRYEKERDEILRINDMKIDSLNREKDLLSEQLELRKQMSEQQDKEAELAKLEAQYQRIAADPTRAKEALEIRKKIDDLRKEMSWEEAERQVKAQQDSIDQQITSLEDYATQVEEYYEDLFAHPQKLIDEMREIIKLSDEEIIAWLQENNEEYAASTENRQKQMTDNWQTTLDEMRGKITTYWEEVEEIISQGDDAIIEFLKENSADYAAAGQLQAEAYVEEWQEKLDDLKKALEEVQTEAAADYDVIEEPEGDGSGSGSGGGGGGGSGGNGGNSQTRYGYTFTDRNTNRQYRSQQVYLDESSALTYGTTQRNAVIAGYRDKGEYNKLANIGPVTTFLKGGMSYKTGLQWLDGTEQDPERVLSPYQTKLFESMVKALEGIDRISIPTMPNFSGMQTTGGGENITVGDIIVQVDNLDTDDDYETLAQKVSEVLMERIGRTLPVGGLRLTAF